MTITQRFLQSLALWYKNYLTIHTRSNKKIEPIHKTIWQILKEKLWGNYTIVAKWIDNDSIKTVWGEYNFEWKYYNKDLDITVLKWDKVISAIAFKFVTSNYKQNSNNYFENMLWETINIRKKNVYYAQMIVLKKDIPYFSNKDKKFSHIEKVNDKNIMKYYKLFTECDDSLYYKADLSYIALVTTWDEEDYKNILNTEINRKDFHEKLSKKEINVWIVNYDELKDRFSDKIIIFLKEYSDFENFIDTFVKNTESI